MSYCFDFSLLDKEKLKSLTQTDLNNYRFDSMSMNWAQRKIYLYNVTFGLYMLDPWERYLFNALVVVLMWFIFYNGYRNLNEIGKRYVW
ncbi:hypothetical protein CTI12_AA429560 [Artemisia annua]|uniref:Uncharacterized protein n=1 Tax=Artemisia annua TaxID=35608 RepID=A0A2U1M230_ARTAN|nr:hypothetical protein CTI12_AA429560 [Artemisia annua]